MKTYEKHFRSLQAAGGVRTVWTLPFPSAAMLTKLIVRQVGGTDVEFQIDIFNSAKVISSSESSGGDDTGGDYTPDPDLFLVCARLPSDTAGKLVKFFEGAEGTFVNMDATGSTNKLRRIYIQIEPSGAEECTWDVALGAVTDVG